MKMVFRSDKKLLNLLGSTKDKTENINKFGIYSIQCGDCNGVYYGQTKRSIGARFKEHSAYIKKNQCKNSAIAAHVLENGHFNVCVENLKLVKPILDDRQLDAYESFYIQSDENTINRDNGNIESYQAT